MLYNDSYNFDLVDYFNVVTNINNQFENNIFDFNNTNKDLSVLLYKNKRICRYKCVTIVWISLCKWFTKKNFNLIIKNFNN